MKTTLRVKEAIKERGMTLSFVAKILGINRSNMSAIASGARGVSLDMLERISGVVGCGIDELIVLKKHDPVYKEKSLVELIQYVENKNFDGADKTWVNRLMIAQKTHYNPSRRKRA